MDKHGPNKLERKKRKFPVILFLMLRISERIRKL